MPHKDKRNPHNRGHDSGLAAPGKKVSKAASHQALRGKAASPAASVAPSSPSALAPTNAEPAPHCSRPGSGPSANVSPGFWAHKDNVCSTDVRAGRASSEASLDTLELGGMTNNLGNSGGMDNLGRPGTSLPQQASILALYPLRDAIAFLIILLSLPSLIVLLIQSLFAAIQLIPPSAGLCHIKKVLSFGRPGAPGFMVMIAIDLVLWVFWLPLWKPVKNMGLDIAQAVLAIAMSGLSATPGGAGFNMACCVLAVCIVHVFRHRLIPVSALSHINPFGYTLHVTSAFDFSPLAAPFPRPPAERGRAFEFLRIALGIHLVSQGLTTYVRRSLVKEKEKDQRVPCLTKADTESGRCLEAGTLDGSAPISATGPDGRSASLSAVTSREGKPRESNTKRKKKQLAHQARSQQPVWAVIASTKVNCVKEYERRNAGHDAYEASEMDSGNSSAKSSFMWVLNVRDTQIDFGVELAPSAKVKGGGAEPGLALSAAIDKSKPFYVRINSAAWSSTRIKESKSHNRYEGEVYGLAPRSGYHCEVIDMATGSVHCSVRIITSATPSEESAATTVTTPPKQAQHSELRPLSPITTLRQSIQSTEAKLGETRSRARKAKRDQRGLHSDIRKEINVFKGKLESSGGMDDKQERRLLQISQHKGQAEEATAELRSQLDALGEIPADEVTKSEAKRDRWQAARDAKQAAEAERDQAQAHAERELNTLRSELAAARAKQEKLEARRAQRTKELEALISRYQLDMTARQKREVEHAQAVEFREKEEMNLQGYIASLQQETQELYQQLAALNGWPTTDTGMNGSNGYSAYRPVIPNARDRSGSVLSQYSTAGEDEPSSKGAPRNSRSWVLRQSNFASSLHDRKASDGGNSGSQTGSTGSNSPRPEAKPFVPSALAKNPIVNRRGNKS
ncbi:hypothetical protein K470DRAFT_254529 [Piedraia hortae CBS 480.64]|uniref:Ubiquitination network signaling protein acrB n=1 Tax=Piedraia hortae CBS 480.64 TaxID=1314780 RepID=A0A6A7CB49_9PEZI|nr:hypothetical protein K470DRAFT_254529 [Piedraia hortae CBS 480.64]